MRSVKSLALVALLGLAGCGSTGAAGTVGPQIPALPAHLGIDCPDPGVRSGQPAVAALALNRQALSVCKRRHRDTAAFYRGMRSRLTK